MDNMETPIESLPGSDNIRMPQSIEQELRQAPRQAPPQLAQQLEPIIQEIQQPNVSYTISKQPSFDLTGLVFTREFGLLILLLLLTDSRYMNVLMSRYLPGSLRGNLIQTLLKVSVVALVFVLVRHFFI